MRNRMGKHQGYRGAEKRTVRDNIATLLGVFKGYTATGHV